MPFKINKVTTLLAVALMVSLACAALPAQCLTPVIQAAYNETKIFRSLHIDQADQQRAPFMHFYGIKACVDIDSGHLTSIQIYLRDGETGALEALPQVGPTHTNVQCKKRKLEFNDYFVDRVQIFETESGSGDVEAIRFDVGDLSETFGIAREDSIVRTYLFDEENQLANLSAVETASGLSQLRPASLDHECMADLLATRNTAKLQTVPFQHEKMRQQNKEMNNVGIYTDALYFVEHSYLLLAVILAHVVLFYLCISERTVKSINYSSLRDNVEHWKGQIQLGQQFQKYPEETIGISNFEPEQKDTKQQTNTAQQKDKEAPPQDPISELSTSSELGEQNQINSQCQRRLRPDNFELTKDF